MKVSSQGGYEHLRSRTLEKGSIKIIVRTGASFTPESTLPVDVRNKQRTMNRGMQDNIIAELETRGHKLSRVHKYSFTPYIAMTVDSSTLDTILASSDVVSIEEDVFIPLTNSWNVDLIGATELHANGLTGAGVAVAILDTGVDKTHPFLQGSIVSEACYSSNDGGSSSLCPGGVDASTAEGSAMPCGGNYISSDCDHGTHVAGIIAGRDNVPGSPGPGVAPEASVIAIQVFSLSGSEIGAWNSDLISGLERVLDLANIYSIASVNMSLGGGLYSTYCDSVSPAMASNINLLKTYGIATVIASGNDYYCGAIAFPACISQAISVGATTNSDEVANYSNNSSFLSLLAPGSSILSSVPGGFYESWNGTSMAAPHAAGAWALMKQAYPVASVDDILASFSSTGLSVADQQCVEQITKRRINVKEAYSLSSNMANLSVSKTGIGTGTVTSSPIDIDCGSICNSWFTKDITVTLTAAADPGSEFGGWSGAGCSGTDPCTLNLSESSVVIALFRKDVTIGTKLLITGSNFGTSKGTVLVGDKAARIEWGGWANNSIIATVRNIPSGSTGIYSLTVLLRATGSIPITFKDTISVKGPEIANPNYQGHSGHPILINGRFFGTKKPKVYVEYADDNGRIKKLRRGVSSLYMDTTTGESTLMFSVPKTLTPGTYVFNIINKVGIAKSSFTLQ